MTSPTLPLLRPSATDAMPTATTDVARSGLDFKVEAGAPFTSGEVEVVSTLASKRDLEATWSSLEPKTIYTQYGRRLFDLALLAIFGLPALALGSLVALINLIAFRSVSKIFFVQERVGYRGQLFSIIKFRTMTEVRGDNYTSWGSGTESMRVTRFGRLLRNTHLDALPQLINVVRGDMAFVGPRPEMVEIENWAAEAVDGFTTRLAVPPGISGYAQITQGYTGFDAEAYQEKFRVADWYRRTQSFGLDLKIIVLTLIWMVRGRGWQWKNSAIAKRVKLPD